ncbi:MAG TPA: SpoIID/LytB domain-containing protein [Anaeromyxobacteraceae bacterium]|nr:SpoIID/LytB domain-containing protein [Anaeromyxobacteraceae bacterium]
MTLASLVLLAALAAAQGTAAVEVELLSSQPCRSLSVEGPGGRHDVALGAGGLLLDGRATGTPLRLPSGRWRVRVPAPAERTFSGALELRSDAQRLRIVARLALEDYVAWTVASETSPGAPAEALRAQAVVARSYAMAAGRRHPDVDLCDLAHCQVLRGGMDPAHLDAARRAAQATRGEVLRLASGRIALAVFHAACGGHTGDPAEVFGGEGTGAAAVPDDGCAPHPWRATISTAIFEGVAAERLGGAALPEGLEWRIGRGGYVVQVALGAAVAGGEAFARALDARLGHRAVRSARFAARTAAGAVRLEGTGLGHGVGLCQAGAARRAAAGASHREILAHYFPGARLSRLPPKGR